MGSTVKNKVLKLTGETPEIIDGIYSIKEGLPINTFYMAKLQVLTLQPVPSCIGYMIPMMKAT